MALILQGLMRASVGSPGATNARTGKSIESTEAVNARTGKTVDVAGAAGGGVAKDAQYVSNVHLLCRLLDRPFSFH